MIKTRTGVQRTFSIVLYLIIPLVWLLAGMEAVVQLLSSGTVILPVGIIKDFLLAAILTFSLYYVSREYNNRISNGDEEYEKLFGKNPYPMWVYDLKTHRFLTVNDAAIALYGYSREEFLTMTMQDIRRSEDVPALLDTVDETDLDMKYQWAGTWRHKIKSGQLIYVEVSSHAIIFEGKKAQLVLSYDVTDKILKDLKLQTVTQELERKVRERTNDLLHLNRTLIDQNKQIKSANLELVTISNQLQEANDKIKEHAALKNRFISMASHEFRTPLATINFAVGFIKRYSHRITPEQFQEKLANIEKQVLHMSHLLNDVLTLGNSDSDKIKINLEPLALNQFIKNILQEVQCANNNSHQVMLTMNEVMPETINTDEKLLRNIFINLLNNAIKYSPDHNVVYLHIHNTSEGICFTIRDNGIGMVPDEMEKIFEPFYRVSNTQTTNIPGTGLGLSIVKRAAELINAEIHVSSEPGKGSVFSVSLPNAIE